MPHSQDILINWTPQETRVAIIESGAVQELHVERTLERAFEVQLLHGAVFDDGDAGFLGGPVDEDVL